eukprot:gnl/Spiro4/12197_TR6439_c0_g1_i1.p1 gnl/Spiro4/12197_TR6439_c0_g1~~gnl/Spiro4/12197_TR6439_c0_g1_i1.p1  ORF type:complete len:352 (+),score=97.34 gnl/Spiro4/12197_TR6439_c0_g1_i1:113-1057(+)
MTLLSVGVAIEFDWLALWFYRVCALWALFCVVVFVLCRLRLAPVFVMRAWFVSILVPNVVLIRIATDLVCGLLQSFGGMTPDQTTRFAATICHYMFWLQTALCPQIQVLAPDPTTAELLRTLPPRAFICLNHCSFYDSFFFVGFVPRDVVVTCRTLIKASLLNIPIFGPISDHCGHFPVYFTSGDSFSVESDKQQAVTEKMKWFVNSTHGRMSVFPEGQLNSRDPAVVQPFRFGSVKFALEHKMPIYLLALWGSHTAWPHSTALGGFPADVTYTMRKFEYDTTCVSLKDHPEGIAELMRAQMQGLVDSLRAAQK